MNTFWFCGEGRKIAINAINENRAWMILGRLYKPSNPEVVKFSYKLIKNIDSKQGEGRLADIPNREKEDDIDFRSVNL